MPESLLLLAPDRYVLRACERLGLAPVVIYGAMHRDSGLQDIPSPAVTVFCEDHRRPEAILTALHRAGYGDHPFTAVQTTNEFVLITAAVLGKALGARAIDPATAVLFKDKSLQKQRVREAGLSTARTAVIEDLFTIDDTFTFPFERAVLKPVAGAGTEATSAVSGLAELLAVAADYRRRRIPNRTFVLEEFVIGDEWTADGVVSGGEVLFYGLGRYDQPCLSTIESQSALRMRKFDPAAESWAYAAADETVRRAIAALGLRDGVFHMELFHDPASGTITFSECAARRGGALTAEEILMKFNVDLGDAAVQCALGRTPKLDVRIRPGAVGSVYLPSRPGTLISCPSPAELTELPGVEFARIEVPFGKQMTALDSTTARIGMVMITADNPVSLERRRVQTLRWFDERLVVAPTGDTTARLRAWHRELSTPYAFADTCYGE
jgi:biotin carboxylase